METFSALLAICAGNHRSPVNSPNKGQWRGALMFSLICAWINGWINNREAGDLRRYCAHYDVTVMIIYVFNHIFSITRANNTLIHITDVSPNLCHKGLIDDSFFMFHLMAFSHNSIVAFEPSKTFSTSIGKNSNIWCLVDIDNFKNTFFRFVEGTSLPLCTSTNEFYLNDQVRQGYIVTSCVIMACTYCN